MKASSVGSLLLPEKLLSPDMSQTGLTSENNLRGHWDGLLPRMATRINHLPPISRSVCKHCRMKPLIRLLSAFISRL